MTGVNDPLAAGDPPVANTSRSLDSRVRASCAIRLRSSRTSHLRKRSRCAGRVPDLAHRGLRRRIAHALKASCESGPKRTMTTGSRLYRLQKLACDHAEAKPQRHDPECREARPLPFFPLHSFDHRGCTGIARAKHARRSASASGHECAIACSRSSGWQEPVAAG
jgi:hypothetical protein